MRPRVEEEQCDDDSLADVGAFQNGDSNCTLGDGDQGLSGWKSIELLRIYDLSTGTRSGRYPNRPPVQDVLLNLGRGIVDKGDKIWCFSEDN